MPDNNLSTLQQIRTKVRRITRSPSFAQLTDDNIDDYVNTFVLYDFPAHLKTFSLRTTLSFYTQPYIDVYSSGDIITNFKNIYSTVYPNVYVAGNILKFFLNRSEFYALNSYKQSIIKIGSGNGVATNFTGTLTSKVFIRNNLSFTSITANNVGIEMHDVPNEPNDGQGTFAGDIGAVGSVNYTTGVYNITFSVAPSDGEDVYAHYLPYSAGVPTTVLYYQDMLTFRPVPEKSYKVDLEVDTRPTELLTAGSIPDLSAWWQYIAYGAAKKVFEDRMDMESVQMIMPEFKMQETLVKRRTIDQINQGQSSTIYNSILYSDIDGLKG